MRSIVLLLLALAPILFGQQKKRTPPAAVPAADTAKPTVFPLETLKVLGNKRLSGDKIIELSGLKIGSPVVKADFDTARARLMATGAFESVGYEFKPSVTNTGYAGVLEVAEVAQLYPYRFEELSIPDSELRAALRKQESVFEDQIPPKGEVLDRYVRVVQEMAGPSVRVIAKMNADPSGYRIVFRPNTPRAQVSEVRFTGNEVVPTSALLRAMSDVAIGTAYSETNVRTILDASIRPLYDARGRIRVAFPKIETERAKEQDGLVVKVEVNEGPSYSLGEVGFGGVSRDDARELKKIANLEPNDVVNFDDINAALDKIYAKFRTKGYLHIGGHAERAIDDQAHRVNVTLVIEPEAQFLMGKLEIKGLDIFSEPPIRKVWNLKTDTPFEPEYPDNFLNDIRQQGVFDNLGKTRAESKIDEKTHTVDVTLYFTGTPPPAEKKRGRGGFGPGQ
jgi:outer membrane protein insertion porin family